MEATETVADASPFVRVSTRMSRGPRGFIVAVVGVTWCPFTAVSNFYTIENPCSGQGLRFAVPLLRKNFVDGGVGRAFAKRFAGGNCAAQFPSRLATGPFDGADDPIARRTG